MAGICRIIAAGVLLTLVFGCVGSRSKWIGTWKGTDPIKVTPGTDAAVANSLQSVTLTVTEKGDYTLIHQIPFKGFVEWGSEEITLQVAQVLNQEPSEPVAPFRVRLLADGRAELIVPGREDLPIELKREAQPRS